MKASKETMIRTIILAITLVNQVLTVLGKNPLPFSDESIYEALSALCTAGASLWAWWKNNSFTSAAILADEYKDQLKGNGVT